MQSYLLGAAGVIFLSVIVSLLVPEGKLNKTITFVMRLICIFVLIQPIGGIFKIKSPEAGADLADYGYVERIYTEHQSGELEKLLDKEFGIPTECNVEVKFNGGNFEVIGVEVEISSPDGEISDKIYAYLAELGYINITVYAKGS